MCTVACLSLRHQEDAATDKHSAMLVKLPTAPLNNSNQKVHLCLTNRQTEVVGPAPGDGAGWSGSVASAVEDVPGSQEGNPVPLRLISLAHRSPGLSCRELRVAR